MSVLNHKSLIKNIISWISDYVKENPLELAITFSDSMEQATLISVLNTYNKTYLLYPKETDKKIFISPISKNEYDLFRSYNKYDHMDLLPFADLYVSEIQSLYDYLESDIAYKEKDYLFPPSSLEWLVRENSRTKIIEMDGDPVRHPAWMGYSGPQRQLVAKAHQREKATRHKYNPNKPIFKIRNIVGLVN